MEIKVIPKRWGSSIAVIIPKEVVVREKIKEDAPIIINVIRERPKAGELFGLLKNWKKSAQEIKDEAREGWLSASDRERDISQDNITKSNLKNSREMLSREKRWKVKK